MGTARRKAVRNTDSPPASSAQSHCPRNEAVVLKFYLLLFPLFGLFWRAQITNSKLLTTQDTDLKQDFNKVVSKVY